MRNIVKVVLLYVSSMFKKIYAVQENLLDSAFHPVTLSHGPSGATGDLSLVNDQIVLKQDVYIY